MTKISTKNIVLIISGFLLIIALIFGSFFLWQSQLPISSLMIMGKAEQEVIPDELNMQFLLEKKGKIQDLEKMNRELDAESKSILEYLKSQNVKSENIKTHKNSYTDYSNYNPDKQAGVDNNPKDEMRNISVDFNFKLENYEQNSNQINQIWQELLKKGVTNLNQDNFDISKNKKSEICEKLQSLAIQNALEKGQKQMKNLGGNQIIKKQIRSVGSNCEDVYPVLPMYRTGAADGGVSGNSQPPSAMPGKTKLEATSELQIDFR